jgi:hypothetical protein
MGLIIVFINGIVTGFAVYIGSHRAKRVIDKFKPKETENPADKELDEIINMVVKLKEKI